MARVLPILSPIMRCCTQFCSSWRNLAISSLEPRFKMSRKFAISGADNMQLSSARRGGSAIAAPGKSFTRTPQRIALEISGCVNVGT